MTRISKTNTPINPEILIWARERAGFTQEELMAKPRFKKLKEWENGQTKPTLKQVKAIASAIYVPVGYLFFSKPPEEPLPIPDFRTFAEKSVKKPSPNLLEMIYACQDRQSWYRDFALKNGDSIPSFVGSASIQMSQKSIAKKMRVTLGFDVDSRRKCKTWTDAFNILIRQAEDAGVVVMVSGIVNSNTKRKLDPDEFRGFALSDPTAPLIFINGKDTKSAQMFTRAHELAHIWIGASALSNSETKPTSDYIKEELWCNAVAAELLVPMDKLRTELRNNETPVDAISRMARIFMVSKLVILRRLLDANCINQEEFENMWKQEIDSLQERPQVRRGGGNFSRLTLSRVGRRFALALIGSTLEGQTLYRDAFRMLGVKKVKTFNEIVQEAGVI